MWPIFRLVLALLKVCVDRQLLTHLDDDDDEVRTRPDDFEHLITLLGQHVELPKLRRELSDPPADVEPTKAGPEDSVSTVVSPHGPS